MRRHSSPSSNASPKTWVQKSQKIRSSPTQAGGLTGRDGGVTRVIAQSWWPWRIDVMALLS